MRLRLRCGFPHIHLSIVVISSVVVIYNRFQIGIARKVQEYGKIKAIGATKKHMKKIIVKRRISSSAIAIPTGLRQDILCLCFCLTVQ